jgi:uncharacterized protein YjbI with pentapeptide repeats
MDKEETAKRFAAGEKDFTGGNLRGVDWRNRIERGKIFREADFTRAYFELSGFDQCDLSFAIFRRVRMYESGFGRCCLEGVDFSDASLSQCSFAENDLTRAIFGGAIISETNFKNANLSYADFTGAREFNSSFPSEGAIFYETIMPDGSIHTD